MKKIFALLIMALFIMNIIPAAFAEPQNSENFGSRKSLDFLGEGARVEVKSETRTTSDTSGSGSSDSNTDVQVKTRQETKVRDGKNETRMKTREEAKAQNRMRVDARLKTLNEKHKQRIESVSEEKQDRLANLSNERLEKIAELDKKQIEHLAELNVKHLEKITALKHERLERLSDLEKDKLEKVAELEEKELEKMTGLNRAHMQKIAKLDKDKIKAELKALHVMRVRNADDLDNRSISADEMAGIKERYQGADDRFKEAKKELQDARKELQDAKKEKDEQKTFENAKEYLLKTADALINHLEKLKAKIQESDNIAEERAANLTAQIDLQISEITGIKAEVEAATTKEQLKEAAKKLRAKWKRLQHIIKLHAEHVVASRVRGMVNNGLVLEKRLDHVLDKMQEQGIEVDVTAEVTQFSSQIAAAQDSYAQAQAKLAAALQLRAQGQTEDSEQVKALITEANVLLKQARDQLKEAHETLKVIVRKIKAAKPDADLSAEVEVEVVTNTAAEASTADVTASVQADTAVGGA